MAGDVVDDAALLNSSKERLPLSEVTS